MSKVSLLLAVVAVMGVVDQAWASVPIPVEQVPEPATGLLILTGVAAGAACRYMKKKSR